jgi:predicted NUDIX family phosphoesterase
MDDEISENILRDTLCRELKEEIFIQKNDIKKIEIL